MQRTLTYEINGALFQESKETETINCGGGSLRFATRHYDSFLADVGHIATKKDEWRKELNTFGGVNEYPTGHKAGNLIPQDRPETVYSKDGKFFTMEFTHFNGHFSNFEQGVEDVVFTQLQPV